MNISIILDRLNGVRRTGLNRWIARCPGHEDRTPSLSIRETDEGTILLHCFAGCNVDEVVRAVGLELADLFPSTTTHHKPREGRPIPALDILRAVAFEVCASPRSRPVRLLMVGPSAWRTRIGFNSPANGLIMRYRWRRGGVVMVKKKTPLQRESEAIEEQAKLLDKKPSPPKPPTPLADRFVIRETADGDQPAGVP